MSARFWGTSAHRDEKGEFAINRSTRITLHIPCTTPQYVRGGADILGTPVSVGRFVWRCPDAKLTPQTMYSLLSGYTRSLPNASEAFSEPQPTFTPASALPFSSGTRPSTPRCSGSSARAQIQRLLSNPEGAVRLLHWKAMSSPTRAPMVMRALGRADVEQSRSFLRWDSIEVKGVPSGVLTPRRTGRMSRRTTPRRRSCREFRRTSKSSVASTGIKNAGPKGNCQARASLRDFARPLLNTIRATATHSSSTRTLSRSYTSAIGWRTSSTPAHALPVEHARGRTTSPPHSGLLASRGSPLHQ